MACSATVALVEAVKVAVGGEVAVKEVADGGAEARAAEGTGRGRKEARQGMAGVHTEGGLEESEEVVELVEVGTARVEAPKGKEGWVGEAMVAEAQVAVERGVGAEEAGGRRGSREGLPLTVAQQGTRKARLGEQLARVLWEEEVRALAAWAVGNAVVMAVGVTAVLTAVARLVAPLGEGEACVAYPLVWQVVFQAVVPKEGVVQVAASVAAVARVAAVAAAVVRVVVGVVEVVVED